MHSRKWKGAKVWRELLPPAKFCHGHHQENLAANVKIGQAQEKGKAQGAAWKC
jgi:hypothetical protein